jgi:integrase
MVTALTTKAVEAAKRGDDRREIPDALVPGLYLVVQPTGVKGWAIRYRSEGRPRKLVLGPLAPTLAGPEPAPVLGKPLTLAGARKVARDQLLAVAAGHDPAADRQAAKAAAKAPQGLDRDLVKTVAAQFLERYLKPRAKPGYYDAVAYIFEKDVLPRWKDRRIQEITRREVLDLLDAVVERGAPVQANRVLAAVRKFLNWAVSRDILAASPAHGVKAPTEENSRERVLTDSEIRLFWLACGKIGYPFGPLAKSLLLTATRREEAAALRRSELSADGKLWILEAHRPKNSRRHEIPLSPPAQAVLDAAPKIAVEKDEKDMPRHGKVRDFVFSTTGRTPVSGFGRAKKRIDASMLSIARKEAVDRGDDPADVTLQPWTFHDLRRTAASGMARLGVALPVIERCLNHVSGSFGGVVGIYQRHTYADEMRVAFEIWGAHVELVCSAPRTAP